MLSIHSDAKVEYKKTPGTARLPRQVAWPMKYSSKSVHATSPTYRRLAGGRLPRTVSSPGSHGLTPDTRFEWSLPCKTKGNSSFLRLRKLCILGRGILSKYSSSKSPSSRCDVRHRSVGQYAEHELGRTRAIPSENAIVQQMDLDLFQHSITELNSAFLQLERARRKHAWDRLTFRSYVRTSRGLMGKANERNRLSRFRPQDGIRKI